MYMYCRMQGSRRLAGLGQHDRCRQRSDEPFYTYFTDYRTISQYGVSAVSS